MSDDIAARIKKVTAAMLKVDESGIDASKRFVEDLGAASIQSIELVAAYEEEFDIDMDQDDALSVKTVGDAIAFITKVVEEQHG